MGAVSHVADYIVIRDSNFEPIVGDLLTAPAFPVNLPPDGVVFNEPSILAYVANPSSGANDLNYQIMYRIVWQGETTDEYKQWDRVIATGQLIGGVKRGLWEVVSGGVMRPSVISSDSPVNVPDYGTRDYGTLSQSVVFQVLSGNGTVRFSDVVIWFQRKVAEAPA